MNDETPTAVIEAEASPLQALEALVAAKEQEIQGLQETLAALWAQRKAGTLDRMGYVDYLKAQDDLERIGQELERLKPQLLYAEAKEAVTQATAQHTRYHETIRQAAELIPQAAAELCRVCQQFVTLWDDQHGALATIPSHDGPPAFEILSGSLVLQRMLNALRQGGAWGAAVLPCLREGGGLTAADGEAALEHAKSGMEPFAPSLVERFLAGYAVPEPSPTEEGVPV